MNHPELPQNIELDIPCGALGATHRHRTTHTRGLTHNAAAGRAERQGATMSEHDEQKALFEWAAWNQGHEPAPCLLFAIPNGGLRMPAVAGKLKAEGLKPGVPDVYLPVARLGYHGFWIEMKFGKNKTTIEQDVWLTALKAEGYMVDVSYGWQEAAHKIARYLGREPQEFGL